MNTSTLPTVRAKIEKLIEDDNRNIRSIEKDMLVYASLIAKRVYNSDEFIGELKKLDDKRDIILQIRDRTQEVLDSLPEMQLDKLERE